MSNSHGYVYPPLKGKPLDGRDGRSNELAANGVFVDTKIGREMRSIDLLSRLAQRLSNADFVQNRDLCRAVLHQGMQAARQLLDQFQTLACIVSDNYFLVGLILPGSPPAVSKQMAHFVAGVVIGCFHPNSFDLREKSPGRGLRPANNFHGYFRFALLGRIVVSRQTFVHQVMKSKVTRMVSFWFPPPQYDIREGRKIKMFKVSFRSNKSFQVLPHLYPFPNILCLQTAIRRHRNEMMGDSICH
jgi:hypothetical protein